jgi:DNA-binding NtrC family response regulator
LVESELFGHVRGAFTDAREAHRGLVQQADGGTLLLDEVEAMNARAQVALLRFLQSKEFRPVGASTVSHSNVRIVCTSNIDLKSMVDRGEFRADLLFRISVLMLTLPPLRDRTGDVRLLANQFIDRMNRHSKAEEKKLKPEVFSYLENHVWPGNVRELENLLLRGFTLSTGHTIELSDLALGPLDHELPKLEATGIKTFKAAKAKAIADFERSYMEALLSRSEGNLSLAARLSGKDRSDLGKLLKKHGLERERFCRKLNGAGFALDA